MGGEGGVKRGRGKGISEWKGQWDRGKGGDDGVVRGRGRDRTDQSGRMNARVKRMMDGGLRDEVASLLAEPAGLSRQAAAAVGYAEMILHLEGKMTLDETIERIKREHGW